jgi:hypothetical protein
MRIVWPNQAEAEHNSLVQEGTQKHMYHPLIRQVRPVFKRMSRVSGRVIFWVLCAMGIAVLTSFLIAPQFILPAEDAVILFQFSRNLATTGAITFIKHGPHAEGATDFGWMVMIAGALKLGIQSVWFVGIANAISSVGLAALLLRIAGCRPRAVQVLFITGVLLATPQYFSAIVGFSTIPFGFLLTLAAFAYLRRKDTLLPLSSLALCLFRPDGVVFAIPMMVAAGRGISRTRAQIHSLPAVFRTPRSDLLPLAVALFRAIPSSSVPCKVQCPACVSPVCPQLGTGECALPLLWSAAAHHRFTRQAPGRGQSPSRRLSHRSADDVLLCHAARSKHRRPILFLPAGVHCHSHCRELACSEVSQLVVHGVRLGGSGALVSGDSRTVPVPILDYPAIPARQPGGDRTRLWKAAPGNDGCDGSGHSPLLLSLESVRRVGTQHR